MEYQPPVQLVSNQRVRKRLIWIFLSGTLMTLFFGAVCFTTSIDDAGHFHTHYLLLAGFVVASIMHVYCTCMSK